MPIARVHIYSKIQLQHMYTHYTNNTMSRIPAHKEACHYPHFRILPTCMLIYIGILKSGAHRAGEGACDYYRWRNSNMAAGY